MPSGNNNQSPNTSDQTKTDDQTPVVSFPLVDEVLPPQINEQLDTTPATVVTDSGSAAPSGDVVMSQVIGTTPPKKKFAGGKVIATILGLFLLVGGVGAGVFLTGQNQNIREEAYTPAASKLDTCNFVEVSFSENPTCPKLENNTGQNNVVTYRTNYTLKNVTNRTHVLQIQKLSRYCTEPYGQINASGGVHCGTGRQTETLELTLNANETKTVEISRRTDSDMSCGSFQTDLILNSIDGNTNCHSPNTGNTTLFGWGMCQTGVTCGFEPARCQNVKAYNETWTEYTAGQLALLKIGNKVNFCASGTASSGSFDKARFIVNGVVQPETTIKRPGSEDFCYLYTLANPNVNNRFNVRAQLHHTTIGWVN